MIDIKINTKNATRFLNNIATKQIPYAAANALNNVAFKVKDEEVKALDKHLDRPTPFTKRGYEVVKANRNMLIASVRARQAQAEYLKYQVHGGSRAPKKKANVVPVGVNLNRYGNMTRNAIKRMLVDKKRYFSGKPKGWGGDAPAGVWRRLGTTNKRLKAGQRGRVQLQLMVAYEGPVEYGELLPFYQVAEVTVGKLIIPAFKAELERALSSAK